MEVNSILTSLQCERYPHFAQLIKDLFENKISSNFVTKPKNFERGKVFREYQKSKTEYDAVKLVYDTIWNILADSSLEDEYLKLLEEAFLSAELDISMKIPKDSDQIDENYLRVFGIDFKLNQQFDGDVRVWTEEKVTQKLLEAGTVILKQLGQDIQSNNQNQGLLLAKISQLPSLISSRLETFTNFKETSIENDQILREQYTKYTSTLLESLKIMEDLLLKQILEIQKEQYASRSESIAVQCDALYLKIKSLYLEIMCETYTKETVMALQKIHKELEKKGEQTEKDIQASKARLNRYETVGQDFNSIVNEYSKLREVLKQKKWTLDKLKSYCP